MKVIYFAALVLVVFGTTLLSAQTQQVTLSGKVKDTETGETIAGVNILVKNTVFGTISDTEGNFTLTTKTQLPLTLVISFLGYKTQEVAVSSPDQSINVQLVPGALLGEEVVISASRVEESELKSPVAIEKLDLLAIKETP